MIEALAVACDLNPEGGSANFNFSTRASHSQLENYLRVVKRGLPPDSFFLRAESLYNVATEIERLGVNRAYGEVSLHEQSHRRILLHPFEKAASGFRHTTGPSARAVFP